VNHRTSLTLTSKVCSATKDGVDRLNRNQDNRERRAIIDWLTPTDFSSEQSDLIARRQKGTGQWVLDSSEFQRWLNTSKQTLFCPGIPGAGKTMISSIVVDQLCKEFQDDASIGVAYLYCNYKRQQQQKSTDLLISLLKQLVQQQPSVPEPVQALYERHKDKPTAPSFDEISNVLHSVASRYYKVFIIIDALDECPQESRKLLLAEIFNLQAKAGASLFATSRLMPEILEAFKGSTSFQISATDEDVQKYLEGHMSQLPAFVSRNPDLQESIKKAIIEAVDGM
jgi:NACHT domain